MVSKAAASQATFSKERTRPKGAGAPTTSRVKRFILISTIVYVMTLVLEGPLRMALSAIGLSSLLYARDLLAMLIVGAALFSVPTLDRSNRTALLLLVYLLITTFFLSVLMGNSMFSAGFGIKIFLSSLMGISLACHVDGKEPLLEKATIAIFVVTMTGVIVNHFYGAFPWEGTSFETVFGTTQTSRVWWADGGVRRLAGFTRTSTLAASVIAVAGAAIMVQWKNTTGKILVAAIGMTGIYLTTSKGLVIAYASTAFIAFLPENSQIQKMAAAVITSLFVLMIAAAPFISWYADISPDFIRHSPPLLSSFADRLSQSWPDTIRNFNNWYQWFVGQGLGEVGVAKSLVSGGARITPTDNIHLFLFVNFGLIGFALFAALSYRTLASLRNGVTPAFATIHVVLGYGIVANVVDDPFTQITLCYAWGLINNIRNQPRPR